MANDFIKAEQVIAQALGLLEREIMLPALVWRDARFDFRGAKNDTITLRVPAYAVARQRTLRAGTPITTDQLHETSVDVRLTTDAYKAVAITDEQMTLDIVNFGEQVNQPVVQSVARKVEDIVGDEMVDADYEVEVDLAESDPYLGLVDARTALNDARVPRGNRFLAVGSAVEAAILKSDRLSKFDSTGDTANVALRDAIIGKIAGFTALGIDGLDPDVAIAAHQTAFVLAAIAPVVPDGVTWGASAAFGGLAMRTIRDYDFTNTSDRFLADVFVGTATTKDHGAINSTTGKFEPAVDPDTDEGSDLVLVRAVKCNLQLGS